MEQGWINVGGDPDGHYDPCRLGVVGRIGEYRDEASSANEWGSGHADTPFSYEYSGYTCTHKNMIDDRGTDFRSRQGFGTQALWNCAVVAYDLQSSAPVDEDQQPGMYEGHAESNANSGWHSTVGMEGTLFRLREGIERFYITDINNPGGSAEAQSDIVVMWDRSMFRQPSGPQYNHIPGGANILYMDGHVAFKKAPPDLDNGDFPLDTGYMWRP